MRCELKCPRGRLVWVGRCGGTVRLIRVVSPVQYTVDALENEVHVLACEYIVFRQIIGQSAGLRVIVAVACYLGTIKALLAQLRLNVEGADTVDFVTEEIHAVGLRTGIRINVEDAASYGVLSGLIYEVHATETHGGDAFRQLCLTCLLMCMQLQAPAGETL